MPVSLEMLVPGEVFKRSAPGYEGRFFIRTTGLSNWCAVDLRDGYMYSEDDFSGEELTRVHAEVVL